LVVPQFGGGTPAGCQQLPARAIRDHTGCGYRAASFDKLPDDPIFSCPPCDKQNLEVDLRAFDVLALEGRSSTERHSHPEISFPDDAACELQTIILDDQVEAICKG
jgi:hypothetical protein